MIWKIPIILHFKFMKCTWTWLLQLVFSWNHYTTCKSFARTLGNIRDPWTTPGESLPIRHLPAPTWGPWIPPDRQPLSPPSICGFFTSRWLAWLSPNSLSMSGCSVHALLHVTHFPLPTPTGPHGTIWRTPISHLGSTNRPAKSSTASCLHIHRETLVSQLQRPPALIIAPSQRQILALRSSPEKTWNCSILWYIYWCL